jgi:chemotaxis protein CheC
MRVDVDTLGTFYEMAHEGAGLAADRLTPMTDIRARVGVTRLNFTTPAAVRAELDDGVRKVGVRVRLSSGLEGTSLVLFDEESAREVADSLLTAVPEADRDGDLSKSAIVEVCQIMNSGFVDGWADVLGTGIDVSAPEYVAGTDPAAFLAADDVADGAGEELAVTFRSKIEAVATEIGFQHYFLPDGDSIRDLFGRGSGEMAIEYEKLAGFDHMATQGARTVAENLSKMTGIDMEVEIRRINFISLDAIPRDVPSERLVSVAFSFSGLPSGYLLFLYDRASAAELVAATVGEDSGGDLGAMERDAIQELSNIMASGMLDGWANVLDSSIDHSTPAYTYDMGAAVVDPLVVGLSDRQEFAFVFDTHIEAVDVEFDLDIYAIPGEESLRAALDRLEVDRVGEAPVTADFEAVESDPAAVSSVEAVERVDAGEPGAAPGTGESESESENESGHGSESGSEGEREGDGT